LSALDYLAGLTTRRARDGQAERFPEYALTDTIRRLPPDQRNAALPTGLRAEDAWHSYDRTPWVHPWLTPENLRAASSFERDLVRDLTARYGGESARSRRYAFIGNLANNMALRALPLRKQGYSVDLFLHPQDRYVMSQPGWELTDRILHKGEHSIDQLQARLPDVPNVFTPPIAAEDELMRLIRAARSTPTRAWPIYSVPSFIRQGDVLQWQDYFTFLPALKALQDYACLFAAQAPYLAYLANRPYLAAQTGGDFWFEASRNDSFGRLQRRSYESASAILATNPWAYSIARRFGFHHVIYVPLIIDTDVYAPGPGLARRAWQQQVGGDFFALVTARIDRRWKASHIGIEGFLRFAQSHPQARLVLVGWGEDSAPDVEELRRAGLEGRLVLLPISGKRKLVEYLRSADCLIDQFAIGYYGATALEAMSTGLPVIMNVLRAQYDALCPTGSPPVLQAKTPTEVMSQLERMAASREQRQDFSTASRRWVVQNHSVEVWGETYGAILNAVASGVRLDFSNAPLAVPLSPTEQAYHADMLASAPPFPNYTI
jgi:glycosyltransferase involved in cell wall biosynthesis